MKLTPPKRNESLLDTDKPTRRTANFFERVATINNKVQDRLNTYSAKNTQEQRTIDASTITTSQLASVVATLIQDLQS